MKYSTTAPICSCGNDLLLVPGSTCDICMGTVVDHAASHHEGQSPYSVDYFEALEQALSNTDLAA